LSPKHLMRIKGRGYGEGWYYFRLHIPLDLRSWFDGRRELKQSLKTSRYDAAQSKLRCHLYRAERLFTLIRSGLFTDEQIKQLVADYLTRTLIAADDVRVDQEDARRRAVAQWDSEEVERGRDADLNWKGRELDSDCCEEHHPASCGGLRLC